MSRSIIACTSSALLGALFAATVTLAACSGGDDPPDPDVIGSGGTRLELVFGDGRLDLARSQPMAEPPSELGLPADLGTDVRWELISRAGVKIAEGSAPDSRALHYEPQPDDVMSGPAKAAAAPLTIEIPDAAGTLKVYDSTGKLLGELAVERSAQQYSADGWTGKADIDWETDLIGDPVLIGGDGVREGKFNLLFVSEGYTEAELPKFEEQVASMWSLLQNVDVYKDHIDQLNIYRQNIKSAESGISDPRANIVKDTAFNASFGDNVVAPRRCLFPAANWRSTTVASVNRLRETTGADIVMMIANTSESGGCATSGMLVQSVESAGDAAMTLAHELGHALFGLRDEYEEGQTTTCAWGSNVASSLALIPWQDMIAPTTPIPTRFGSDLPDYDPKLVGAFQGGGRCTLNAWRPADTCKMRISSEEFCPVCKRIAEQTFAMKRDPTLVARCMPRPSIIVASADDGNKPTNVADGKITTRWASNGSGQWIQFESLSERTLAGIDIAWNKGNLRKSNYVISVSSDGTNYAVVAAGKSSGTTEYKERIAFSPIKARYLRVTVNGNSVNSWASINEAAACVIEAP
ncbi:MAG: M64 family metallopeptidase [Kofleriaceae bacterium]